MVTVAEAPKSATLWHKQITRILAEIEKQTSKNGKKATKRSARRFLHPLSATRFLNSFRILS